MLGLVIEEEQETFVWMKGKKGVYVGIKQTFYNLLQYKILIKLVKCTKFIMLTINDISY